jgi:rubredoxin
MRQDLRPASPRSSYWTIFGRCWRLRCPVCGRGKQFNGWFRMRASCEACGYSYQREPGYFLGSIYINYGLTALLVTVGFFVGFFALDISPELLLIGLTFFCVAFPLWFFRYARSLWMGFDTFWDPVSSAEQRRADQDEAVKS